MNFTIGDFLSNAKPFLEEQNFEEFHKELLKVPNFEEKFQEELAQKPTWLSVALKSRDKEGFHVSFLLVRITAIRQKNNELALMNFCMETVPTIKVTVYEVLGGWK